MHNYSGIGYNAHNANGQRLMKASLHRNGAILNGGDGEAQNSYIADSYTVYVNPYYIITHYANWTEATKHYYKGSHSRRDLTQASRRRSGVIARPSPPFWRERVAAALEADNDLSDIETSPQPIGAITNLLSLLNIVGAKEDVDYNELALYGEEPQTYAQAVMSLEDYELIIEQELEEDPGNPPEPGNQDRCTFSRYWPFVNHELDCDPVIYFYHSDYLGHTEYITYRNGHAYQFFHYSAFGEALIEEHSGQGTHTDYLRFNGKELDPETGNYYYGARYYDPKVSIWLSVDELAHKYPELSPYASVANNPINLVDPDGRDIWRAENGRLTLYKKTSDNYNVFQNAKGTEIFHTNQKVNWSSKDRPVIETMKDFKNIVGLIADDLAAQNTMKDRAAETGWDNSQYNSAGDFVGSMKDLNESQDIADAIGVGKDVALTVAAPGGVPIYDDATLMEQGNELINNGETIPETMMRTGQQAVDNGKSYWMDLKSSIISTINNVENAVKKGQAPW